jgi:hypothetical protein
VAIVARANRPHDVTELHQLGVNAVIQPEFEGGVEMVGQALIQYPHDKPAIARLLAEIRTEFYGGEPNREAHPSPT